MTIQAKRRKTGGRKPGSLNKTTHEMRALAQEHGALAIATLVAIMRHAMSESARVAAANSILDRGYGKPGPLLQTEDQFTLNIGSPSNLSDDQQCAQLGITLDDWHELKKRVGEMY